MFFGRQVGHSPSSGASRWWGWLGVWPLAVALAPDHVRGDLLPRRPAAVAAVAPRRRRGRGARRWAAPRVSAIWPVEYAAAGVVTPHPFHAGTPDCRRAGVGRGRASGVRRVPAAVGGRGGARWRSSDGAVGASWAGWSWPPASRWPRCCVGLAIWGTPVPGLLSAALLPVAAGWAIVHGQHVAAYSALTWLSRTGPESEDLPTDLARPWPRRSRAGGDAVDGPRDELQAVGVWPETGEDIPPRDLDLLEASPDHQVRAVRAGRRGRRPQRRRTRSDRCPWPRAGCSTTSPPRPRSSSTTSTSARSSRASGGPATWRG